MSAAAAAVDVPLLSGWAETLVWVGVIVLVAAICLWIVRKTERRSVTRVLRGGETVAARQRGTAVSALAAGISYVVVLAAVIAIIATVFGASSVAALSGSAFVILVLGFAVQRLLADVVAGFFILFESQYAVGDLIEVDSTIPIGIVERASLRVTTLRGLNGDVIYVPNSQVKAAHRFSQTDRKTRTHS